MATAFLSSPELSPDKGGGENEFVSFGYCAMQGYRSSMEDRHSAHIDLPESPQVSYFAVYDGHAGSEASSYCEKNLMRNILTQPAWKDSKHSAIVKGFLQTDREFRRYAEKSRIIDGTTVVTAFVTPERLIVAHCGDSKCVLSQRGKALPLTDDHKPSNNKESERISRAGGFVLGGRVNGQLAVSRAIGDYPFKSNTAKGQEEQLVVAVPEVRMHNRTPRDEFLILACDGLWDVMTPQVAVDFVRRQMRTNQDLARVAEAIVNAAIVDLYSRDNVSVLIVKLKNIQTIPSPSVLSTPTKNSPSSSSPKSPFAGSPKNSFSPARKVVDISREMKRPSPSLETRRSKSVSPSKNFSPQRMQLNPYTPTKHRAGI